MLWGMVCIFPRFPQFSFEFCFWLLFCLLEVVVVVILAALEFILRASLLQAGALFLATPPGFL
jgi:hypothetical protein